jgi:hypothetical protein
MGCCNPRRVFPIIRVTAMELVTTNNHKPMQLGFYFLRCCAKKAISFCSSTCIRDRESRSPKPLSSAILHREMVNKVFGKRSSRLLACFFKFFITARLPLCWTRAEDRHLQRKLHQVDRCLHPNVVVKESQVMYSFSS